MICAALSHQMNSPAPRGLNRTGFDETQPVGIRQPHQLLGGEAIGGANSAGETSPLALWSVRVLTI